MNSDLEVHGGRTLVFLLELVVLAGKNGIEENADDGGDGETGQGDHADLDAAGIVDADRQHEDKRSDDDVAGVGEVHLIFHHVAHADGGDHAVQHKRHAADGGGGHCGDERRKLRAEGDDNGNAGRDADNAGVVDAGERQHAGVLAVGGVGRRAEQGRQRGGQTVAQQRAVEAGIDHIVFAAG